MTALLIGPRTPLISALAPHLAGLACPLQPVDAADLASARSDATLLVLSDGAGNTEWSAAVAASRQWGCLLIAPADLVPDLDGEDSFPVATLPVPETPDLPLHLRGLLQRAAEVRELHLRRAQLRRIRTLLAHDLRSPLTSILLSRDLLAQYGDRLTPADHDQHYANIAECVQRIEASFIEIVQELQPLKEETTKS